MRTSGHVNGLRRKHFLALAVGAAALVAPAIARAGLVLTLEQTGFAPLVIADGSINDGSSDPGVIDYSGPYGDFSSNLTAVFSNNPGEPDAGRIEVQSRDVRSIAASGVKTLKISASDTGFTLPGVPNELLQLHSTVGGSVGKSVLGDTVTFQSFADPLDAQPPVSVSTAVQSFVLPTSIPTVSFSDLLGQDTLFPRGLGAYSLGNVSQVTISPGATVKFTMTTETFPTGTFVPEPGSAAILLGFAALGIARRRRPA